jgi:flagellar basal-body rod modification protein FlgD
MAIPAILMSVAGGILSGVIQNVLAPGSASTAVPSQSLGKDDFLRLLTTQLQNQDPLSPMDNTAFVAQMAQFSSLEQLQNLNGSLEQLASQMAAAGPATAASLLGQVITANGTPLELQPGRATSLPYVLPQEATAVTLQIRDATGKSVRTLLLGPQAQGMQVVSFDGLDDRGQPLPSGPYTFSVQAVDATGRMIPGVYTAAGRVSGVSLENGQLVLQVGMQRIPLSAVVSILAE